MSNIALRRRTRDSHQARLFLRCLEDRTTPATFTVTNLFDAGAGSLRDAIGKANTNPDADTIIFAPALAGFQVSLSTIGDGSIGPSGLFISSPITIQGSGQTITRAIGAANFRLFAVGMNGNLTLQNLTLQNGLAQGGAGGGGGGGAAGLGGAIYNQGTLNILGSTITGNQAIGGATTGSGSPSLGHGGAGLGGSGDLNGNGGPPNGGASSGQNGGDGGFGGGGGAGFSRGGNGGFGGGGGYGDGVTAGFGGNAGFGGGGGAGGLNGQHGFGGNNGPGGFGAPGDDLNGAGSGIGGAVFNQGGIVVVTNSTLSGNIARGGDAITANPGQPGQAFGGGIFNLNGSLTLNNVTIAGNTVIAGAPAFSSEASGTADGGALYNACTNVGSDTSGQTAFVAVVDCIFANSVGGSDVVNNHDFGTATINATGSNIVSVPVTNNSGDLSGTLFMVTNPRLGPLANNGGFTPTMALLPGSPAINAGDPTTVTPDQRGIPVQAGRRDIGAFEYVPVVVPREFSIGRDKTGASTASLRNQNNSIRFTLTPFETTFTGGIRTASADFTGDGVADLAVASGPGRPGQVAVFDGVSQKLIFTTIPFGGGFTRGVLVAAGDLNADGLADLIVTAEAGGGARVRVFQSTGSGFFQRADYIALIDGNGVPDSKIFRGGSRAAVSDINGDGYGDLIWAAGAGGGPRIATFDGKQLGSNGGPKLSGDFFALSTTLRDGAFIAGGDFNGDGKQDIVAGGGSGAPPEVVIYSGIDLIQNKYTKLADFTYGNPNTRQGVRVAVKDLDGDGRADLILGSAPTAGSHVTAYAGLNLGLGNPPTPLFEFDAFPGFTGGVFVG